MYYICTDCFLPAAYHMESWSKVFCYHETDASGLLIRPQGGSGPAAKELSSQMVRTHQNMVKISIKKEKGMGEIVFDFSLSS